ncbi:MAG: cell division septal protein, partial [Blautia sp.]|nr:cell division septal protein [Blautia sp.]
MEQEEYYSSIPKWIVLGCLLALLAGGGILFFLYYSVDAVEVIGTTRYTDQEVKDMVLQGPASGNCILASHFLSRDNVTDIPYVDALHVSVLDHHKICITVREKKAVGCFPYLDSYIYFDRNGVFFISDRKRDDTIPYFSGISVKNVIQNEKLDLKGASVLNTAIVLATIFQKSEFLPDDIRFDENGQISLIYKEITVSLGKDEYLEDKLSRVLAILPKIEGRSGILHVEMVSSSSRTITFELAVTEENWDGGYDEKGEYTGDGSYDKNGNYVGPKPGSRERAVQELIERKAEEKNTSSANVKPSSVRDSDRDGYDDETGEKINTRDMDGDGYDDSTGEKINSRDQDGDGYDDSTGEKINSRDQDGDGYDDSTGKKINSRDLDGDNYDDETDEYI